MRKKALLSVLSLALAILFICPSARAGYIEEKDGKTIIHVTVSQLPDPTSVSTNQRADVEVVRQFRREFPKIFAEKYKAKYKANPEKYGNYNWDHVEIVLDRFSGIKVEGVESDLLAIAGDMASDILYINFRKSDNYISNGFIQPLDRYYKELTPKQIASRVHNKIIPVVHRKGPDGKVHWWTMPYGGLLGKILIYRKDLFDEYKIDPPNAKWTWKDLLNACKKMTDPAKGIYGIRMGRGKHESHNWITFLWSAGGDVMTYNKEKDTWLCTFDSDAAVKALDFYVQLSAELWTDKNGKKRQGYAYKEATESSAKWDRGEIAMQFTYIEETLLATIQPEVTGMAVVPIGPGGHRGGELNSRMFGMYSQIKSQAICDAAWEYMFYYDSLPAQKLRTKIMVEGGMGKFINPKYLKMFGYADILKLVPKGWEETLNIAIETGQPEPYGKNSNFAYAEMTKPIQLAEQMERKNELAAIGTKERERQLKKILVNGCAHANEIMIGKIPSREMFWRRFSAWCLLAGIATMFFFVFRKVYRIFTPPKDDGATQGSWQFKRYVWAYIILIPAVASVAMWRYVPLIRGSYMAFFDYKIIGDSTFVLVDNFATLLWSLEWWNALWNAVRYSLLTITMTFMPPIILAIFLQEVPRFKILLRTLYYLPAVVTGLVTMVLWKQFYEPSELGMMNKIVMNVPAIGFIVIGAGLFYIFLAFAKRLKFYELKMPMWLCLIAGLLVFYTVASLSAPIFIQGQDSDIYSKMWANVNEFNWVSVKAVPACLWETMKLWGGRLFSFTPLPYQWLSTDDTAMFACILPMVWAGMGPGCLIYLAALKGIPNDYYEAADIDGATFIDKILFVVFPTLKALIIINFVGVFIASWTRSTGQILVMTGGGANTETAGLSIWYKAFTYLQMGPATAMAWTLGFMLIGFTVYQLQILSKVEFRAAGKTK
jgi:ABC-type sugar transport system permease subunit/ABC-type glycerol-3-phosphate transport system substrate-binding protein